MLLSHAYLVPLVVSFVLGLIFSWMAWARRRAPGGWAAALMVAGAAVWSAATIFEISVADRDLKLFWCQVEYLGIATIPYFWFVFSAQYSGVGIQLTRSRLYLLALIPFATIVLMWTTPHHQLMYRTYEVVPYADMLYFSIKYGAWFPVHAIYSYLLVLAGMTLIGTLWVRGGPVHRRQAALLILSALVPWAMSLTYVLRVGPWRGFDFTPFAFIVPSIACLYALWRHGLCDLVPVARDLVLESLEDGVVVLDEHRRIMDANPAMQAITGVPVRQLQGQPAEACLGAWFTPRLLQGEPARVAIPPLSPQRGARHFDVRITALRAKAGASGWVLVLRDITEQQAAEERLAALAHYDHLTGLPNRFLFYDRLAVVLARGRRYNLQTAVLFIDLDGFKEANDTYGHAVGDQLLRMVGERMQRSLRETDTVARLGGDEFLVVAPDIQHVDGAIEAARRVLRAFEQPFVVEAHSIMVKGSVGVAVAPPHGSTAEELVHNADRAMYEAKACGKNTWYLHGERRTPASVQETAHSASSHLTAE